MLARPSPRTKPGIIRDVNQPARPWFRWINNGMGKDLRALPAYVTSVVFDGYRCVNLNWTNSSVGRFGTPTIGEFKNGRGDFYDQEPHNGKSILIRFSIWGITADTAQSEQAFSEDGGKTWETNWINRYTRMSD